MVSSTLPVRAIKTRPRGSLQAYHKNQDMDIFVRSQDLALIRCYLEVGKRLQPVSPPLYRHGPGQYLVNRRPIW